MMASSTGATGAEGTLLRPWGSHLEDHQVGPGKKPRKRQQAASVPSDAKKQKLDTRRQQQVAANFDDMSEMRDLVEILERDEYLSSDGLTPPKEEPFDATDEERFALTKEAEDPGMSPVGKMTPAQVNWMIDEVEKPCVELVRVPELESCKLNPDLTRTSSTLC